MDRSGEIRLLRAELGMGSNILDGAVQITCGDKMKFLLMKIYDFATVGSEIVYIFQKINKKFPAKKYFIFEKKYCTVEQNPTADVARAVHLKKKI